MHKCYTFLIFMVLLLPSLGLSRYSMFLFLPAMQLNVKLFHQLIFVSLDILINFFLSLYLYSLDVFFRWLFDKRFLADAKVRFE